ncbi:hypothetical protein K488DRAFT_26266, partial [Vararia minispora EC-137]
VWWVCERETSWKSLVAPQCPLGKDVAIAQVVTEVIADAILIFAPLFLLSCVMNKALRIRLVAVFLTTAVSTVFSLYHAWAVFTVGGTIEARAASFQVSL